MLNFANCSLNETMPNMRMRNREPAEDDVVAVRRTKLARFAVHLIAAPHGARSQTGTYGRS